MDGIINSFFSKPIQQNKYYTAYKQMISPLYFIQNTNHSGNVSGKYL